MNLFSINNILIVGSCLLSMLATQGVAQGQSVRAQISAREVWVGTPVILQLQITNAEDYEAPELPIIDGCRVEAAGAPAQSSQITIINGRRSESRSITMQYLITPQRAGSFEIPALQLSVDGRAQETQPLRFSAVKSETGDLLFAEIEGGKDRVFVGQPLDLTLKIWLKPFRDKQGRTVLSEAQMWQMLSDQTSWGSFAERMQGLAKNNQRPGGRAVMREDSQGEEREYYLYEIDATAYPTRSGKIDASDVQIVVNYPLSIGKARDPFAGMFEDSPLGGRMGGSSMLRQMMNDDFFGSPFGNRLAVKSARPVVADVQVDSTEVLPVPTVGRPADYRGAVGHYRIVTEAEPTHVSAGDPITLRIGVIGDGPMELVQAPPLADMPTVIDSFKVSDQNLAGFVQDDTKVFVTTVRPRQQGINEIPAIPFSFFDPDTETFETVYSRPISITVDKAETLSMDAIVGNAKSSRNEDDGDAMASSWFLEVPVDFNNDLSESVLQAERVSSLQNYVIWIIGIPAMIWLLVLMRGMGTSIAAVLPGLRSPRARSLAALESAKDAAAISASLIRFIASRTKQRSVDSATAAVGALRHRGMHSVANDVESLLNKLDNGHMMAKQESVLEDREMAKELVCKIDEGLNATHRVHVRPTKASTQRNRRGHMAGLVLLAFLPWMQVNSVVAEESVSQGQEAPVQQVLELSEIQQSLILQEANELYQQAQTVAADDAADAMSLFGRAASKYQMLIDAGIENASLYQNAGNANLQSGHLGQAIANYRRGLKLNPSNRQLQSNLNFAQNRIHSVDQESEKNTEGERQSVVTRGGQVLSLITGWIGSATIFWSLAIASLCFWSLMIMRSLGYRHAALRWGLATSLPVLLACAALSFSNVEANADHVGIVVADQVELRAGDGKGFEVLASQTLLEGQEVKVITNRGGWRKVQTNDGHTGWLEAKAIEDI